MEVYRGKRDQNAKIFESPYFVEDPLAKIPMSFTDAQLCNGDQDSPIEIKFISRNQYKMTNTEICYAETTLNALKALSGDPKGL